MFSFDEINQLQWLITKIRSASDLRKVERLKEDCDDLLGYAYFIGMLDTDEEMGTESVADYDLLEKSVNRPIDGLTAKQRIEEDIALNDSESLEKLLNTEFHRISMDGAYDTAVKNGARFKKWVTMGDERVRDPHRVIDGIKVPIDALFYTDGDSADRPGNFASPDLNINCRCWLVYET